ncbi:MAG: ribonuclease H-like domain-containing protein [Pseudomonadota bacterium]
MPNAKISVHQGDLPDDISFGDRVAIDTETLGLKPHRDRLCVVQLSAGDGTAHLVQIAQGQTSAPNIQRLVEDTSVLKLFHFARFDVAILKKAFGVTTTPVFCTKIASKLARTYTDRHGLKDLCSELVGVELSKVQQSSDWAAKKLTDQQQAYAASDVLHLHALHDKLQMMLAREGRTAFAEAAFSFLPTRCDLDLAGFEDADIFAH